MTAAVLSDKLAEINQQITILENERKNLVWNEGVPALIAKMKEIGKDVIELRAAEDKGYFDTEDLWGDFEGGYFAVKKLKLNEDDQLVAIYNTIWNQEESYGSSWNYGNEDMSIDVDEEFSNAILTNIIDVLLTNDDIYDIIVEDNAEEKKEDDEEEDDMLQWMFGIDDDDSNINVLEVAKNKDFRDEIHFVISNYLNKDHFTIAIGVEVGDYVDELILRCEDQLILRCEKQFDDENFELLAAIIKKYFGDVLPFYTINCLDFLDEEPELLTPVTDNISIINDDVNQVVINY